MSEFRMPSLGADMDEGTVVQWLVGPGDPVHRGDVIAVVDTAKAAVEVECFATGTVGELLVAEGARVPVGTPLATIEPGTTDTEVPGTVARAEPVDIAEQVGPSKAVPAPEGPHVTPLVRRLAAESGVDLGTVRGSAPGGRIVRADVERAAAAVGAEETATASAGASAAEPAGSTSHRTPSEPGRQRVSAYARRLAGELGVDLGAVRGTGTGGAVGARDVRAAAQRAEKPEQEPAAERPEAVAAPVRKKSSTRRAAIADLMARSKREIPHYYLSTSIDLRSASDWLRDHNLRVPVHERLVYAALLVKATALAAAEVPQLNGHWVAGQFVPSGDVHVAVTVSLRESGLITPTVSNADTASLEELMGRLRDVTARARTGRVRSSDTAEASITVTNLGDLGVESVLGVIFPPQVALVGFGSVGDRPGAVNGLLGVRPMVTATLAADHRASDGATGARFLNAVDRLLQLPEEL